MANTNIKAMPGVATFGKFDTRDFADEVIDKNEPLVETQASKPAMARRKKPQSKAPSARRTMSAVKELSGIAETIDFADPVQMANLAARYTSLSEALFTMAKKQAEFENELAARDAVIEERNAKIEELNQSLKDMNVSLKNEKEKVELLRDAPIVQAKATIAYLKYGMVGLFGLVCVFVFMFG